MNSNHTCVSLRLAGVAVAVASLSAPLVATAQASSAQQLYRDAVAACNSGERTQSRADCMYEARSVLRDAREGRAWTRDGSTGDMSTERAQMDRDGQTGMQNGMQNEMRRDRGQRNNRDGQMQRRSPATGNSPDAQQPNNGSTPQVPR
jgi:hypothetical protein